MADGDQPTIVPTEIPKGLPPLAILQNPPQGEMPKDKRGRVRNTITQVDAALLKHTANNVTDRRAAAEELGMSYASLNTRIANEPFLMSRWSAAAKLRSLRDAMVKLDNGDEQIDLTGVIHRAIDVQMMGLSDISKRLITQIRALEIRIERNDQAIEMDESHSDYKKSRKYIFLRNFKGDPTEEMMVRDNLARLMEEYRCQAEAGVGSMLTKAKASSLLSSRGTQGPGAPKKRGLGVAPKGSRPVVSGPTQINTQGGTVILQNGNHQSTAE